MRLITNPLLAVAFIFVSILSCQKEVKIDDPVITGGSGPVVNPNPVQGTVTGKVVDNNDNVIVGAVVKTGNNKFQRSFSSSLSRKPGSIADL